MENKTIKCGKLNISNTHQITLIAGPCQLENEKHAIDVAKTLKTITKKLNIHRHSDNCSRAPKQSPVYPPRCLLKYLKDKRNNIASGNKMNTNSVLK